MKLVYFKPSAGELATRHSFFTREPALVMLGEKTAFQATREAQLVNLETGEKTGLGLKVGAYPGALAANLAGSRVAVTCDFAQLQVIELTPRPRLRSMKMNVGVVCFTPDDRVLVESAGRLCVVDPSCTEVKVLQKAVEAVQVSRAGVVVTRSRTKGVNVLRPPYKTLEPWAASWPSHLDDTGEYAVCSTNDALHLCQLSTGKEVGRWSHDPLLGSGLNKEERVFALGGDAVARVHVAYAGSQTVTVDVLTVGVQKPARLVCVLDDAKKDLPVAESVRVGFSRAGVLLNSERLVRFGSK